MKPSLSLRVSQHLALTPQLQQAIKLLQLSNLDLSAFVEEELERNPLLERAADAYEKLPCRFCDYASHCKDAEINRTMGNPDSVQSAPSWLRSDKM